MDATTLSGLFEAPWVTKEAQASTGFAKMGEKFSNLSSLIGLYEHADCRIAESS